MSCTCNHSCTHNNTFNTTSNRKSTHMHAANLCSNNASTDTPWYPSLLDIQSVWCSCSKHNHQWETNNHKREYECMNAIDGVCACDNSQTWAQRHWHWSLLVSLRTSHNKTLVACSFHFISQFMRHTLANIYWLRWMQNNTTTHSNTTNLSAWAYFPHSCACVVQSLSCFSVAHNLLTHHTHDWHSSHHHFNKQQTVVVAQCFAQLRTQQLFLHVQLIQT